MNRVTHFEIPATDPEKLVEFYSGVFGWQFTQWGGPVEYWLVNTGDAGPGINGGLLRRQDPGEPIINIIEVESVDDCLAKVVAAGGTVVVPKMAVPTVGWFAYFKDPDGNLSGMMQEDETAA